MTLGWTKDREGYVSKHYGTEPVRITAQYLGVTVGALVGKARRMGLTVASRNPTKKPKKIISTKSQPAKKTVPKVAQRSIASSNAMKKKLVDLWNLGTLPSKIATECGYKSAAEVSKLAQNMGLRYQYQMKTEHRKLKAGEPEPLGDVEGGCLYPHGKATERNFCGHEKEHKNSYCEFHMGVCYVKRPKKERKPRSGPYVPECGGMGG